ncbi:MAG: hydroxymethylbilane synthase [Acidimicrobiales bacterium]
MPLRLATRGSPLALWQAGHVASLLAAAHPGLEVELVTVTTTGDRRSELPVWEMGGRGVFVGEVQAAVLTGRADAAVHSAKDLQPVEKPGLCLAAVPLRGDPRDVLVGATLSELGPGATIATGSQRRRAQLACLRPDLSFVGLRGNISTRLARVPPGGAVVVAMAALTRLGLAPEPMEALGVDVMVPQVAQGALAVECRDDDDASRDLLRTLDEPFSRRCVDAERSFLAAIGGACDLPVAGHATVTPEGQLQLEGLLAAPDGSAVVRRRARAGPSDGARLGAQVAEMVLGGGGGDLLAAR